MVVFALMTTLAFPAQTAPMASPPPLTASSPSTSSSCPDAAWVSFWPEAPYDPAVADVAALVWLPNLLFPCPALFLGMGQASLKGPLPKGGSATGIALGHSIAIGCCGLPLAATIIGAPLVALETAWIAPVSVLNALDRDVRCARQNTSAKRPAPPSAKSPPSSSSSLPPPSSTTPTPNPGASRSDPLPPPLSPPPKVPLAMAY
jgi:hypothetical protein